MSLSCNLTTPSPLFSRPPSEELSFENCSPVVSFSNASSRDSTPKELLGNNGLISKVEQVGVTNLDIYGSNIACPIPISYRKKQDVQKALKKIRDEENFLAQRANAKIEETRNFDLQNDVFFKEYDNILITIARIKKVNPTTNKSLIYSIIQQEILQKNSDGKTPLHLAAELGDDKAIREMLGFLSDEDKEICLQMRDNLGRTAFHLAMLNSSAGNCLKELLAALKEDKRASFLLIYDDFGKTALHYISDPQPYILDPQSNMSRKLVAIFLKIRNPMDRHDLLEAQDKENKTPLHHAAMGVDPNVLKNMIDIASIENLFQIDNYGRTFFHYLIRNLRTESFFEPGINPLNRNDPTNPANILSKMQKEFYEIIKNLLTKILNNSKYELVRFINIQDKDRKTALFYAANSHNTLDPFLMILQMVSSSNEKVFCLTVFIDEVDFLIHYLARKEDLMLFIEVLRLLSDEDREHLIKKINSRGETISDVLIQRKNLINSND